MHYATEIPFIHRKIKHFSKNYIDYIETRNRVRGRVYGLTSTPLTFSSVTNKINQPRITIINAVKFTYLCVHDFSFAQHSHSCIVHVCLYSSIVSYMQSHTHALYTHF